MSSTPIIALVGPTASGKTDLGIALARRFDAEIVSADSRQVYRKLDIGSAKPTPAQQAAVAHHLIDVVDADQDFDVAQYRDLAERAIADIEARGKRVLVVGGTGLYVNVLRGGLFEGPSRDAPLRARLEAEELADPGSLYRRLLAVDPQSAARLHPNDRVRLVRAVEVFELSGRPLSEWHRQHAAARADREVRILAIDLQREVLYARINKRCAAMIDAGLVEEVRGLYAIGYDPKLLSLQSLGYREIGAYVRGECELEVAIEQMARATRNFAKRQLTWFRGHPPVEWLPPRELDLIAAVRTAWD